MLVLSLIFLRTTVLDAACTGQRVNNTHLLFSLPQQLFVIIPMPSALSMPLALLTGRLTEKELLVGMMTSKLPLLHARAVSCTQPASHARTEAGDVPISKENAHARAVSWCRDNPNAEQCIHLFSRECIDVMTECHHQWHHLKHLGAHNLQPVD
jgi:hypothetical protein